MSKISVVLQPAFVLHRRPYRETSLIVELFTLDYGRLAVVARGVRKARSRMAALLQSFMPLFVSCYGKGELLSLSQVEANGFLRRLSGKNLRCGFYLNELLLGLLPKQDPHALLFEYYQQTLEALESAAFAELDCEKALRRFEKKLLMELGYGLPLRTELKFKNEAHYRFHAGQGFLPCLLTETKSKHGLCSGKALNALITENFEDHSLLQEIKQLMRFILTSILGRSLESRRLFEYPVEVEENV